jgi:hypothetical protein
MSRKRNKTQPVDIRAEYDFSSGQRGRFTAPDVSDLLPEYEFDYAKAQPNRFTVATAGTMPEPGRGPDKPTDS